MTRKMIRRITLTASVLPLVASFSGCKEGQQAQQAAPPEVEVVTVEQKDVPIYREFVGTLAGDINATISAQVTGYLVSRDYVEGSIVTNGQVLFQIDPAPFKAALDKAKAQLAQAQAQEHKYALDVKRYRPLAATQAISQQDLDDAIQGQEGTQAQVDAARRPG
jgi:membrane fusion protein, multidrug efflux system